MGDIVYCLGPISPLFWNVGTHSDFVPHVEGVAVDSIGLSDASESDIDGVESNKEVNVEEDWDVALSYFILISSV